MQQFLHQRKQHGKTITKVGLDALLVKLAALTEQNVHTMINSIQQSMYYEYSKASRIPKYDTKKEDLDFLEW